jgi:hypothetical protein
MKTLYIVPELSSWAPMMAADHDGGEDQAGLARRF